jgi:hypothetical protein
MFGDKSSRRSFNKERTLFIIKKRRPAPIDNEATRERTQCGEHGAAPLFTDFNAS